MMHSLQAQIISHQREIQNLVREQKLVAYDAALELGVTKEELESYVIVDNSEGHVVFRLAPKEDMK